LHNGRDFAAGRLRVILKARAALATMRVADERVAEGLTVRLRGE
jgi:hypothetical protein